MKKIFSTVAMAMVAFVSVVSMASCSNDSPSSFNAAPQVPTTTTQSQTTSSSNTKADDNKVNYHYKATVSKDILAVFDVNIVRTAGSDVKTYSFTEESDNDGCMETVMDNMTLDENVEVNVKATFTLKANYEEVLNKMKAERGDTAKFNSTAAPGYCFPVMGSTKTHMLCYVCEMFDPLNELTKADLMKKAEGLSKSLSVTNKQ